MTNISKKQTSLAVVAVVFATALFVSVIASNNAFADKNARQSLSQSCHQDQKSQVVTAGANSPVRNSGNNVGLCVNLNGGGNAAAQ
jgi:hypothetical protein